MSKFIQVNCTQLSLCINSDHIVALVPYIMNAADRLSPQCGIIMQHTTYHAFETKKEIIDLINDRDYFAGQEVVNTDVYGELARLKENQAILQNNLKVLENLVTPTGFQSGDDKEEGDE